MYEDGKWSKRSNKQQQKLLGIIKYIFHHAKELKIDFFFAIHTQKYNTKTTIAVGADEVQKNNSYT